ncbi:MAG: M48 family metallopeptidase [Leptolyngbyaceae bacterium]|nr:M48 family metallopeptidase [Leptolyngbyaceae bacterium]
MSIELPPGTADYSDRTPTTSNRAVLKLLALFFATIIVVIWLAGAIANSLIGLIPPQAEQALGKAIVPAYEAQALPSPTQDTLNQMLDQLEQHLPPEMQEGRDFQVFYVPQDVINAVAIPGDRVIIYQGLLEQAESENELMMVLGHELGHFENRDHIRGLGQKILLRLAIASIFGDVGTLGSIAASGVTALSDSQFSQKQERQADEVGLDLLNQVYGQVAGATDFFARMSEKQGLEIAFLASHPTSASRVRRIESLIQKRGYSVGERSPLPPPLTNLPAPRPSGSSG